MKKLVLVLVSMFVLGGCATTPNEKEFWYTGNENIKSPLPGVLDTSVNIGRTTFSNELGTAVAKEVRQAVQGIFK